MSRDSEKRRNKSRNQDDDVGADKGRTGRSAKPHRSPVDDSDAGELQEIRVTLVDEALNAGRKDEVVDSQAQPEATITGSGSNHIISISSDDFTAVRTKHVVNRTTAPKRELRKSSTSLHIPVADGLQADSTVIPEIRTISPSQQIEKRELIEVTTSEMMSIDQIQHRVVDQRQPVGQESQNQTAMQDQTQRRVPVELDEKDPVFEWFGGSPYGSARPKLVLHRSPEEVTTLPFLQVLLRDTYKELEGGEPGAEMVEFVANEPRIPQIQKNIVTLDVTGSDWASSMRNGEPVIERNGVDVVPTLKDVVSTLYTGKLGYFVVNLPTKWEGDLLQAQFFETLIEQLVDTPVEEVDETQSVFDLLRSSPVMVADPLVKDDDELYEQVGHYFSLRDNTAADSTVNQIEAGAERLLRRHDWKRIALTERQQTTAESDEHYFWKAAIAEGIAWEMYRWYQQETSDDTIRFNSFLQTEILASDRIQTEYLFHSSGDNGNTVVADIYIDEKQEWVKNAVAEFVPAEVTTDWSVAIEFETGRSEGAFNFRKLRETLEKYEEINESKLQICVVLPSRLLFRGRKRAAMIVELVESWSELQEVNQMGAELFVPVVRDEYCRGLQPVEPFIEKLYRESTINE